MENALTDDANAILLLCAFQGGEAEHQPLNIKEYNQVARSLHESDRCPGDLLFTESVAEIARDSYISPDRLRWLLDRRINLGFRLEEWQRKGIWVLARSDENYPKIIRKRMGNSAPPLIFGTGNQALLNTGGLAIIGPDKNPDGRIEKVCKVAGKFVSQGQNIIAAGHLRMAERIVQVVRENTGHAIWVLHNRYLRLRFKKSYRQAISDDHLVMITAQSPHAPEESGEKSVIGGLATGLATRILYVDGSNSAERKDQYEIKKAALRRSEDCWLFHGSTISPEGQELGKGGAQLWNERRPDPPQTPKGELFG